MKISIVKMILVVLLPGLLMSCAGLAYTDNQSWIIRENRVKNKRPTLAILAVQVDMTNSRDSIEREVMSLAPLYFWNNRCRVIPLSDNPDYAAKIYVRERDIRRGWKVKKSLTVEVHIWKAENAPNAVTPIHERKLPAAVGRTVAAGEKSFSSSKITEQMLSEAIGTASKKLTVHKRRTPNG